MKPIVVLLLIASFGVLVLSLLSWRLTSSRSVIFNGLLGSIALIFAAYFAVTREERNLFLIYTIPFVVGMALMGRWLGLWMRVKTEPDLKLPAIYLLAAGVLSSVVSVAAFITK